MSRFTIVLVLSAGLVVYDMLGRFTSITSPAGLFIPVVAIFGAWGLVGGWIGWQVVQILGERMGRLYWPKETVIPPPLYFLTESYEQQGRIGEALHEYQKIIRYHPGELQAHIGQLHCLSIQGLAPRRLWKVYERSFRQLESDRDRQLLTQAYEKLSAIAAESRQAGAG